MSTFLRRAGRGRDPDDHEVRWSIAEGRRGRRWRWTLLSGEGRLLRTTLVEVDPYGTFARLELESAAGMLTFHPEPDGQSAHGNVVRAGGVEPIAVGWSADSRVGLRGDAFGTAVLGWAGQGWIVGEALTLLSTSEELATLPLDERGVPRLATSEEWALEA